METFEKNGKTVENKPIVMVEIFWDGDTENYGMGNWEILDEKNLTGRYVYMSVYRSEESAERGYKRWLEDLDKRCREAVELHGNLLELEVDKKYPSVMKEFEEASGYDVSWDYCCMKGDFSPIHPKSHIFIHTDTKKMNESFDSLYEPHYEED